MTTEAGVTALAQAVGGDIKGLRRAASCNAGGIVSGVYYDNSYLGGASAVLAASAGVIAVVPFMSAVAMPIDRLAIVVSTAGAAGIVDLHIYECLANGWPGAKLYSSAALSPASTGKKEVTLSFTFEAGKTYWLGVRTGVTFSLRGIAMAAAKQLGMITADGSGTAYATALVQNSAVAGAAPDPWGAVSLAQLSSIIPPSIRFRAV